MGRARASRPTTASASLSARARALAAPAKRWLAAQLAQQPLVCLAAAGIGAIVAIAIVDATVFGARVKHIASVAALNDYYRERGYVAPAVAVGATAVLRVHLANIPAGWADDQPVAVKKSLFFRTLLPLILTVNEDIGRDRRRLQQLAAAYRSDGDITRARDRAWLYRLAQRYEVAAADELLSDDTPLGAFIAPLLRRVDAIPPSLALAQAAVESGYGTSRFAIEGNALFGQWRTGGGLRPRAQPAHLSAFGIATFATPLDSVAAYAHNLNTFAAYRDFRARRAALRGSARAGLALADTLTAYSERGAAYIATLRQLITENRLLRFDAARLDGGRALTLHLKP